MAKNAKEFLTYLKEHPEERELRRTLSAAEYEAHVNALGFKFTKEELDEAMETRLQLSADALDSVAGGSCSSITCEYHSENMEDLKEHYNCG